MNFWDYLWLLLWAFFFVMYLIVLFQILGDLFGDSKLAGWAKALWVIGLIVFPLIGSLVYLIARGGGMGQRAHAHAKATQQATDSYIRSVAGTDPVSQIANAKALLDSGAISQEEFDTLKGQVLAQRS